VLITIVLVKEKKEKADTAKKIKTLIEDKEDNKV